jgi:ABC-2 type transport system permease protein
MTALAGLRPPSAVRLKRPGVVGLFADQLRYALHELWRSRLVLIFTFVLPLAWLGIIGTLAGNETISPDSELRVMQFVTPAALVMGVLFATYPQVAYSLAVAREQKIVKRVRGTPLPMWLFLAGRVGAATVLAFAAVVVMLGVAIAGFDVQLIARTLPAFIVTLIVAIAALSALGLAVGALAASGSAAQMFAVASGMILLFISGLFTVGGEPPEVLVTIGSAFPVGHVLAMLQTQLNPFLTGDGWDPAGLAFVIAWGVGGLLVATWALRREPVVRGGSSTGGYGARQAGTLAAAQLDRPSLARIVLDQIGWANATARRAPSTLFFAIGMPAGLYALMSLMYGDSGLARSGLPFAAFFAVGMSVYGIAVTAFIDMPNEVVRARDRLLLKRLRGTPTSGWQYLAGRTFSVLWIGLLTAVLIFAIGVVFFDVEVPVSGLPLALVVFVLGTLTIAACGYALASVMPSARATAAAGLAILLPLSFFSDVFVIGNSIPDWMTTVGSIFPLRPYVHALADALAPAGSSIDWANFGVMAAWLVVASAIAVRRFRWEP